MDTIPGCIGPLLVNGIDTVHTPDLIPTYTCLTWQSLHRLIRHIGLIRAEVAVRESVGGALAVGKDIEKLSRVGDARLWQAVT